MLSTKHLPHYIKLMRADKPIGTYLVLWPTLWALWLATGDIPTLSNLIIFSLGAFIMRSAGCVINDYADRHFDKHVARTQARPLTAGDISEKEALWLFVLLILVAMGLVAMTNLMTILLAPGALVIASIYPFMKRHTHLPQVVLGAAFSWSIPMAYAAQSHSLSAETWWLFLANLLWVVAYDTYYAMVDRNDDVLIGIKSTAVLFGYYDRIIIALLQGLFLLVMYFIGASRDIGIAYNIALIISIGLFVHQSYITKQRDRMACFNAFLHNNRVGIVMLIGIIFGV